MAPEVELEPTTLRLTVQTEKNEQRTRLGSARRVDLLRGYLAQLQNLGWIAAGIDMRLSRPVATLAMAPPCAAMQKRQLGMWV